MTFYFASLSFILSKNCYFWVLFDYTDTNLIPQDVTVAEDGVF